MGSKLSRWIKHIRETQNEEISCSECLEQVSRYVDLELSVEDADQRMPEIVHHLDQCKVCREEYMVLRELAHLEAEGELPTNEELLKRLKHQPR